MRKYCMIALVALLFVLGANAQTDLVAQTNLVKVKLRVILIDKDLNQKPVPFFVVNLRSVMERNSVTEVKTSLDGTVEKQLPAGTYSITTPKPVELGGKRYTWNLDLKIKGPEQQVDLTNDNAKIEDIVSATNSSATKNSDSAAAAGDLTALFDKLKNSVVTVRAEGGMGSGFLVDSSGLVVTNNHVAESSSYLAVQFDEKRKVPAKLIAANPDKTLPFCGSI